MQTLFGIPTSSYRRFVRTATPFGLVLVFFFVSGACGLIYQVVWTRKLVLLFGTTAFAVSTVLSVFFLGLGIGSFWGGRLADTVRRPLLFYAACEVVMGLWAIAFVLGFDHVEAAIVEILRLVSTSRAAGVTVRAVLAAALMLVPVTLMGATLPLLAKTVARSEHRRGLAIGALYVLNTTGAVAGCLFAGLYGIEMLGYTRTTAVAAAANIAVGIFAMLLIGLFRPTTHRSSSRPVTQGKTAPSALPAIAAFACSGFCTLALEVLWTRLLTLVFIGTTYAYTVMLASILCGIAVGSMIGAAVADRVRRPLFVFGLVECMTGLACLLTPAYIARLPDTVESIRGHFSATLSGPIALYLPAAFSILLVPTTLIGMTFPLAVRAVTRQERLGGDVGLLYGVNTFGGVVGAIVGGYVLLPALGAHTGIVVLGLFLVSVGLVLAFADGVRYTTKTATGLVTALALYLVYVQLPTDAGRALNRAYIPAEQQVVAYRDGVEGTVVVSEPEGNWTASNRALWINGVQATQSIQKGIRLNRFQGVLPFLFDREPREALLICFGSGVTAGTLAHSDLQVTGVEISRDVLEMAALFAVDNWDALENPRLKMVVDDGRNFLLTREATYDIITFEPMPLVVSGVSTFYSVEFYELCRERLTPRGIVVQWMPLHGTNLNVLRSLIATFHHVFPECSAWFINADLFLVGSLEPLRIDYERARERYADPKIAAGLVAAGIPDLPELLSCYFMSTHGVRAFAAGAPIMRDDRPWAEFVVPRELDPRATGVSLAALRPYYENPAESLRVSESAADGEALRAILHRRSSARRLTLEGIEAVYAHGPMAHPEDYFERALEIDPNDYVARAYYREMLPQLFALLTRWEDYEAAEKLLARFSKNVPEAFEIWKFRGDLYTAMGDVTRAEEAYRQYAALTTLPDTPAPSPS